MIVVKVFLRKIIWVYFVMSKVYFVIDNILVYIYKFKYIDFNYLLNYVLCIWEYIEDK